MPVRAIAALVQPTLCTISFAIEAVRKAIIARVRCTIGSAIQTSIDSLTFVIETVVNAITAIVKAIIDAIAAVVEAVFNTVTAIVEAICNGIGFVSQNVVGHQRQCSDQQAGFSCVPCIQFVHVTAP